MSQARRRGAAAKTLGTTPSGYGAWLAVALLAPAFGLLVGRWPIPSLVAFAAVVLVGGVIMSREFALGAILVSSLVMLGATSWLGLPVQSALLTKVLIGLFALSVVLDWTPETPLRIPVVFTMLVAVLLVSAAFGSGGRFASVQAIGAYLAAPIAYLAIVHSSLTVNSLRRITWVVLFIIAAQAPIMIVQSRIVSSVDDIGGTFGIGGSTQILAVILGAAWTIAVALLVSRKRLWLVPIGLSIAAVLMISQAKAGFLFAAAGTIAVGVAKAVSNPRRGVYVLVLYLVIGVAVIAVLFGAYVFLGGLLPGGQTASNMWVAWLRNPSAIIDYLFSYDTGGQAGRLEGTRLVLTQSRTMANLLIGQGPGILGGSALLGQESASGSAMSFTLSWATSVTRFLLEVGLVATLLYLAAVAVAVGSVVKAWAAPRDQLGISVGAAAVGMAAVYVTAAFYAAPWTTDAMAVTFWCLLGMAVKWGSLRSAGSERSQEAVATHESA